MEYVTVQVDSQLWEAFSQVARKHRRKPQTLLNELIREYLEREDDLAWWEERNMKKRKMTLTGLVKKEGSQYAALCLELDVASCGDTQAEAIAALRDAIDTYVEYMVTERREQEIYRPVPVDALREFLTGAEKPRRVTYHSIRAIPLEHSYAA